MLLGQPNHALISVSALLDDRELTVSSSSSRSKYLQLRRCLLCDLNATFVYVDM